MNKAELEAKKAKTAARKARRDANKGFLASCAVPPHGPGTLQDAQEGPLPPTPRRRTPRTPVRKARKKKSPTLPKLKKILWREISALVRSWSEVCLACKSRPTEVAAHIVPSHEGAATRFFLPNLYPCCSICNGLEKWNRGSWVKVHESMFGTDYVDALYAYSETIFDLDKAWVIEQTERMRRLREPQKQEPYARPQA